jgi:hypothetical protein
MTLLFLIALRAPQKFWDANLVCIEN